jgi:opacity protein-like surface antigen
MVLVAMSFFKSPLSQAQTETPRSFKIKTPNTKKQLQAEDESLEKDETSGRVNSVAPRRIQQHGLGFGIGETFLLGNYAKTGEDKITLDLLYSYAASYSFDLLINAHMSEHKDNSERMRLMGLTGSVKARVVEFDNFSPYFLGGLGFYLPEAKRSVDGSNTWSDKKVTFGLNFGGGADLRLNENYAVGVMGQMHWPFAIKQDEGSDIKGYYFKLLITGMYLF